MVNATRKTPYRGHAIEETAGACWVSIKGDGSYHFADLAAAMRWVDDRIDGAGQ